MGLLRHRLGADADPPDGAGAAVGLGLTMARKPEAPNKPLRGWRVSIMREKVHYLGRVVAPDKETAIAKAMEEFRIEPARRFRLIAEMAEWPLRLPLQPSASAATGRPSPAKIRPGPRAV